MNKILKKLEGWKTHIGVLAWLVGTMAVKQEWMATETWTHIEPLVYGWTGVSFVSKMNRIAKPDRSG